MSTGRRKSEAKSSSSKRSKKNTEKSLQPVAVTIDSIANIIQSTPHNEWRQRINIDHINFIKNRHILLGILSKLDIRLASYFLIEYSDLLYPYLLDKQHLQFDQDMLKLFPDTIKYEVVNVYLKYLANNISDLFQVADNLNPHEYRSVFLSRIGGLNLQRMINSVMDLGDLFKYAGAYNHKEMIVKIGPAKICSLITNLNDIMQLITYSCADACLSLLPEAFFLNRFSNHIELMAFMKDVRADRKLTILRYFQHDAGRFINSPDRYQQFRQTFRPEDHQHYDDVMAITIYRTGCASLLAFQSDIILYKRILTKVLEHLKSLLLPQSHLFSNPESKVNVPVFYKCLARALNEPVDESFVTGLDAKLTLFPPATRELYDMILRPIYVEHIQKLKPGNNVPSLRPKKN